MSDHQDQVSELVMWLAAHGERAICRCRERVQLPSPPGHPPMVRTTWEVFPALGPPFLIVKERPAAVAGRSSPGLWELAVYDPDGPNERSTIVGDPANQDIAHLSNHFDRTTGQPPRGAIQMPAAVADRYRAETGGTWGAPSGASAPTSKAIPFAFLWFLLFAALCAIWIVQAVRDSEVTIAATRTPTGATRTVDLTAGGYTVYVEAARLGGDDSREAGDFGATVTIRPVGGDPLPLGGYSGDVSTDSAGGTSYALATVQVPADGRYTITSTGRQRTVVLGPQGELGRTLLKIFLGVGIAVFGLVSAVVIAVVGQRRRSRRWRRSVGG